MNILVIGADGQLGRAIFNSPVMGKTSNIYFFTSVHNQMFLHLNINETEYVNKFIQDNNIRVVINCAAFTNVDQAELNPDACYELNYEKVIPIIEKMKEVGGLFIGFSSDYVFSGAKRNTPYTEKDKHEYLNVYGQSKGLLEDYITKHPGHALIFRTSWLFSEYGNNFITRIHEKMNNHVPEIQVINNCFGSPTYAGDLAEAVLDVVEHKVKFSPSIYNFCNAGIASWYDLAKMYEIFAYGSDRGIVQPISSAEFMEKADKFVVTKPHFSALDTTKYQEVFKKKPQHWAGALNNIVDKLIL